MNYSHRFFLYAPVAGVLALAVALSLYWFEASSSLAKRLDAVNGHAVMPGVTLHFGHREISGFPFRVDAIIDDLTVDVATAHGPIEWSTPHFAMHSLDYGQMHLIFEAAGRQHLSWHDTQGRIHELAFTPAIFRASALGHHGRVGRVDVELIGATGPAFAAAHAEFHLRQDPGKNALDLVAMADGLRWNQAPENALARLRLAATMAPGAVWDGLLGGNASLAVATAAFRAANGALQIDRLELDWGKANAKGKGRLSLDSVLRPQGVLRLSVEGLPDKIDAHGILPALMGAAKGAPMPVTLAFTDGIAYVNSAPAGFVDPLD